MIIRINSESNNIPKKGNATDAAYDCTAVSVNETDDYIEYGLGFSLEIPKGFAGFIYPRSSISKYDLILCNSVGVIDSGFRDELHRARASTISSNSYCIPLTLQFNL